MAPMLFTDDWKEFLRSANSNRLRYLVVGGVAVNLHGYSRSTHDMDIWIANTSANIQRLKQTLIDFGFAEQADSIPHMLGQRDVIFLGKTPFRIDILSGISGLIFSQVYNSRKVYLLDDLSVPFIDLVSLIVNKQASGRNKDKADLDVLRQLTQQ